MSGRSRLRQFERVHRHQQWCAQVSRMQQSVPAPPRRCLSLLRPTRLRAPAARIARPPTRRHIEAAAATLPFGGNRHLGAANVGLPPGKRARSRREPWSRAQPAEERLDGEAGLDVRHEQLADDEAAADGELSFSALTRWDPPDRWRLHWRRASVPPPASHRSGDGLAPELRGRRSRSPPWDAAGGGGG